MLNYQVLIDAFAAAEEVRQRGGCHDDFVVLKADMAPIDPLEIVKADHLVPPVFQLAFLYNCFSASV